YVNMRDIALTPDGVWVDGFVNQNAKFGALSVSGPVTCIGTPFCNLEYHVGGFLARISEANNLDIRLSLGISRELNVSGQDLYYPRPALLSVSPPPTTTDVVESPNAQFSANSSGSSSAVLMSSLDSVISECTNGLWTLYINKNSASEQQYKFRVSIGNLT